MTLADFADLRDRFPSARRWTYMMTHSLGPCPAEAFDDLATYIETLRDRPHSLEAWGERFYEMHRLLEQVVDASEGAVAIRDTATACHAAIMGSLPRSDPRNRILVSGSSFPSIHYLAQAQVRRGFVVEVVEPSEPGRLLADDLIVRLDERVAAVLVPVVAPFNGSLLDVARLVEAVAAAGAVPVLDAYAAVGIVPLSVSELAPCVLIGGTVKWLCGGGTGLAFMAIHPLLLDRLVPADPGWMADARFLEFRRDHVPAAGARRFEQGTPPIEPIYSARAGIRFVLQSGVAALHRRNATQLRRIVTRAAEHGLVVRSPPDATGLVAIEVNDAPHVVATLRARNMAIDTRGPSTVRLGPHACVSLDDCNRVVDEIGTLQRGGARVP